MDSVIVLHHTMTDGYVIIRQNLWNTPDGTAFTLSGTLLQENSQHKKAQHCKGYKQACGM